MRITNWDNHWTKINIDPLIGLRNPQNWSDYQWLHTIHILDSQIGSLKNIKKLKMLECGAGTASVSRYFHKKYNFENIILDNSIEAITTANTFIKNDNLNIKPILSDIKNMPFENDYFDIIYLGGVFEYLDEIDLCMKEINRVLKPGGILLFVVVPNVFNIQIIGDSLLFIKNILKGKQTKLVPSNVKKWYADNYILKLQNNDFDSCNFFYLNPFPLIPLPSFLKKIYLRLIKSQEKRIIKFNFSNFYLKKYLSVSFLIKSNKKVSSENSY